MNWPMSRRHLLRALTILALAIILAVLAWRMAAAPARIRAGYLEGSEEAALLTAFSSVLEADGRTLRVSAVAFSSAGELGRALDSGRIDAAILEPDLVASTSALTAAIIAERALLLAAARGSVEASEPDWSRVRLKIRGDDMRTGKILQQVWAHQGLPAPDFSAARDGAPAARGQVAAASIRLGQKLDAATLAWFKEVLGANVQFIDLPDLSGISATSPFLREHALKAAGLPRGMRPAGDEISTVSVSSRLMVRRDLDRRIVALTLEELFGARQALARASRLATSMKGVDPDEAPQALTPVHAGAMDYYAREQRTFMDLYGDWLWLGVFAMGGVSSAATWAVQRYRRMRRAAIDRLLDKLEDLLERARAAQPGQADALADELAVVVRDAIRQTRRQRTDARTMGALMLAIDGTRSAIRERQGRP